MTAKGRYIQIAGISASSGIAIGKAFLYRKEIPQVRRRRVMPHQVEAEVDRFLKTLHQAGEEIRRTRRLVEAEQGESLAQIFDVQLAMLEDVAVKDQTLALIREKHYSAERAFFQVFQELKEGFAHIENEYMRQRLEDVIDIEQQVLSRLSGGGLQGLQSLRADTIFIAHDLLPSESVQLGRRLVKGIVLDEGGPTSHAAIIARSLGLPTVLGADSCSREVQPGDLVIVDGYEGVVHLRPDSAALERYRVQLRRQQRRERDLSAQRDLPAVTQDGREIVLMANIDVPSEIKVALENASRGVGMYRTEFLYLDYRLPTEEEQLAAYRRIVRAVTPQPVVIRTIDLGGDKLVHVLGSAPEANPFLGWRGIRICLDTPELFKTQLRALLRAGAEGEVRILLPMVSHLDELRQVKAILAETQEELRAEGREFCEHCPLGIMVEVPSVALMVDAFAEEVDFLSLGTNDLTQYTLAVDRSTARVADLYDPFHPAVLRLIEMVTDSGRRHGIPVSICGEMAGDPLATLLLIGLGIECLSMSPGLIPEVKAVIRASSLEQARQIADHCLKLKTGNAVRQYLEEKVGQLLPHRQALGPRRKRVRDLGRRSIEAKKLPQIEGVKD